MSLRGKVSMYRNGEPQICKMIILKYENIQLITDRCLQNISKMEPNWTFFGAVIVAQTSFKNTLSFSDCSTNKTKMINKL